MAESFLTILSPVVFGWLVLGVASGITVGAIPGVTGAMLIALTLPMTYYMHSVDALVLLTGMYVGAITGGLIMATMFSIPGTPSSIVTTFDGFPMAQQGKANRALALGVLSSFVGGIVSWIFLALLARPITWIALGFGNFDYFALVLMGLVMIASVSRGSTLKGLLAGGLGMLVAMPGMDPSSGQLRLQFGSNEMLDGFTTLPVLVGVFAVTVVIEGVFTGDVQLRREGRISRFVEISFSDVRRHWWSMLRSSLIGTWIGILPGVGGGVASIVSYTVAKNSSKKPEKFGTGCEEGVIASEAANNASICGALIPLVSLGLPGSVIDVFLLGALVIHNLNPGPLLFRLSPDVVHAIIAAALVGQFVMLAIMWVATGQIARLAYVRKCYLLPIIMVFCVIGIFGASSRMFDVGVLLGFGLVGILLRLARIPLGPFAIGYILAPIAETNLRSGLMATNGSFLPMFTEPVTVVFLLIAVAMLIWPFVQERRQRSAKAR